MPDPLSIAALVSLKGAQEFSKHRDRSRARSKEEEMEAMKRILEALGKNVGQGGQVGVQPSAATQGLNAVNQQTDPLAQQMIAELFKSILGGGPSGT